MVTGGLWLLKVKLLVVQAGAGDNVYFVWASTIMFIIHCTGISEFPKIFDI
jgi:hypothetical protein